jgi:hypothetical protein
MVRRDADAGDVDSPNRTPNDGRPTAPPPEFARAHRKLDAGDLDSAFDEITTFTEHASASEPWLVAALFDLGMIHEMRGQSAAALERYDEALAHLARLDETEHKWLYDIAQGVQTRGDWLCRPKASRAGPWFAALATYVGAILPALGLDHLRQNRQSRR